MSCTCRQCFCWLCGQATGRDHTWENIAGHSCGRYKEEADRKVEEAQKELERYLHYHSRWKAHADSLKLEDKTARGLREKTERLEEQAQCDVLPDFAWLLSGLEQLFRSRRCLSFSYVFAYFAFGGKMFADDFTPEANKINQGLFEDTQQELEAAIELCDTRAAIG